MSKITNDGLTRAGTGCFIAIPVWQQRGVMQRVNGRRTGPGVEQERYNERHIYSGTEDGCRVLTTAAAVAQRCVQVEYQ